MFLPFGTWSAASSFSLGGLAGWGAFVFVWVGAGATASALVPALGVALLVGGLVGIAIHLANVFKGATMSALNGQDPKNDKTAKVPRSGKVFTGMVAASYIALSAITVAGVTTQAGPEAYQSGYEAGISDIRTIENSQQGNNIQVATATKKPTKTPTPRPNPTKIKTSQPSYPTLYADQNYKCREGPGKAYGHIADIFQGTSYKIIGRASNGWYAIAINSSSTSHKYCWIGGGNVSGDLSQVEYYEIPPTLPASSSDNGGSSSMYVWIYIGPHWTGEEISCQKVGSFYWQNTPSSGGATTYSADINNDGNYDYKVDIVDVRRYCPSIGTSMFHK